MASSSRSVPKIWIARAPDGPLNASVRQMAIEYTPSPIDAPGTQTRIGSRSSLPVSIRRRIVVSSTWKTSGSEKKPVPPPGDPWAFYRFLVPRRAGGAGSSLPGDVPGARWPLALCFFFQHRPSQLLQPIPVRLISQPDSSAKEYRSPLLMKTAGVKIRPGAGKRDPRLQDGSVSLRSRV